MAKLTKLSRSVAGKVALITGAGSGMGRATAFVFAEAGAKVVVSDINEKQIAEVAKEIDSSEGACLKQVLDVTNQENINEAVTNVIKEFGQLDILVNNAGISIPTTIDDENYEILHHKSTKIKTNYHGPYTLKNKSDYQVYARMS